VNYPPIEVSGDIRPLHFAVHTTTTKLIYVAFGFTVFVLSYVYRKLIVALGIIAFFGFVLFCVGMAFLGWVLK